ncbi:hypothetical protein V8B97DRAFT_1873585 [Scleroderma yunnanense]
MSSSGFNADVTLGPALIGTTVASCLFGCSVVQTYGYYRRFPLDTLILKLLALHALSFYILTFPRLLTLAHLICIVYWTWTMTVSSFGHPNEITIFATPRTVNLIITPFICYLVQLFFAYRLFKFSGSWLLAAVCIILGGISFVGTLIDAARALNRKSMHGNMNAQYWLTVLSLVSGAVCDLIITAGLVFYLRKRRAVIKVSRTIDLIDKLTIWSIETGLVTSINAVFVTIFFSIQRTTFIWIGLYMVLGDVYTNVFLAALNSRTPHVQHHFDPEPMLTTMVLQAAISNTSASDRNVSHQVLWVVRPLR